MSTSSFVLNPTAAQVVATRVRWKIFLLMLMLTSINYIDRTSLSVAMPLIGDEFGLDPAMQGLILSSFFWTYAFMQVPGGVLADRYKPRIVIALSTVGWGFFQTVAAFSTNWVMLLLTRLGLGVTEAPIFPTGGKLNAIWMTPNERARGATLLDGGAPLGAALGAMVIAGLITGLGSWRLAFIIAGIGTMACGPLAWWYIRNSPREHPMVSEAEARHIEEAHAAEDAQNPHIGAGSCVGYFRFRSVWCMCLGWMFFNTVWFGLLTWLPNYLFKVHGLNIATLGGATFTIFFSGFVGELVAGCISDNWRTRGGRPNQVYRTMFAVAALFATVSIFAVGYLKNPIAVVAVLSVVLFFLRWCGMYFAIPPILATRDRAGFLCGGMNFAGNIAGIIVPIIVGLIVQITGSYFLAMMFFASAGIALLICSIAIDYSRKLPV
jgi:ACS family D-galactonate transporter-like MFS transporter